MLHPLAVHNQQGRPTLFENRRRPRHRLRSVQDDVELSCLQHPQHGRDNRDAISDQQRHRLRSCFAHGQDGVRNTVGKPVQFAIGCSRLRVNDGDLVRIETRLLLEQRRDGLLHVFS